MEGDGSDESQNVMEVDQEAEEFNFVDFLHPLSLPHILENVFQHLTRPSDMMSTRLVSKQWCESATHIYRKAKDPASFGNSRFGRAMNHQYSLEMEKFLGLMKKSKMIPVTRYNFRDTFFGQENQQLMKEFLRLCGPDAVELCFYFDNNNTMEFSHESFKDLNLAKLKTLTFHGEHNEEDSIAGKLPDVLIFIELLLKSATNLQKFQINICSDEEEWKTFGKELGGKIGSFIPPTVKILGLLDIPLSETTLNILGEIKFKLEELAFDFQLVKRQELIGQLISKQTDSLKTLKLANNSATSSVIDVKLPRLDKLLYLDILGFVGPFSCAALFPNLIALNAEDLENETFWLEMLSSCRKTVSVKEIYLPCELPRGPFVQKLSQAFPSIQKLSINSWHGIENRLADVFVNFAEIKELSISFPISGIEVNLDCILSGVSEEDLRRIQQEDDFENVNLGEVQQRPSLHNLTKLEKLTLDQAGGDVRLSDFSVHFVFMRMTALAELHTSIYDMSFEYIQRLRTRLALDLHMSYLSDSEDEDSDSEHDEESDSDLD